MHKIIAAIVALVAAPAVAGDLAEPTVKKTDDKYVVTFHVEHPRDVGTRIHDHAELAMQALGSVSSSQNLVSARSAGGFDVTFGISK